MEILLVGFGGAVGSITRFALGRHLSAKAKTSFPQGTFVINVSGALLLGILVALQKNGSNPYLLLGDGFLGAYTTFSTFMYEGWKLLEDNEPGMAAKYIAGSLVTGIIGFIVGILFANTMII